MTGDPLVHWDLSLCGLLLSSSAMSLCCWCVCVHMLDKHLQMDGWMDELKVEVREKHGREWRRREIPSTDKGSVSFINGPVHCSAAQLIQAGNFCLSHFIWATSHAQIQPVSTDTQVRQDRLLAKWSEMGRWERRRRISNCAQNGSCVSSLCSSGISFKAPVKNAPWWLFTADTSFSDLLCSQAYIESLS